MAYIRLQQPLRGFTDQQSYRSQGGDYTRRAMNVLPFDVWERRLRIGTRQGFCAIADMADGGNGYRIQGLLPYTLYRSGDLITRVLVVMNGKVYDCASNGPQPTAMAVYATVAATTTVTISVAPVPTDATIVIIDGTFPTAVTRTYTAKTAENLALGHFSNDGNPGAHAASLEACIEHSAGHNGSITVSTDGAVLTLTQATGGTQGNTAVATTGMAGTPEVTVAGGAFTGGTGEVPLVPATLSTSALKVEMAMFREYAYMTDGANYFRIKLTDAVPKVEHWWEWKDAEATNKTVAGESSTNVRPNNATLLTVWGARIVLSGFPATPNVWVASTVADANQFNEASGSDVGGIAGGNSPEFAVLGDKITAIVPFGSSGLLLACKDSMSYMNSDPVFGATTLMQLSREVGAIGPRAVTEGPEKSAFVIASDGVYHVRPNDFDINRGDKISAGALDGLFSRTDAEDLDSALAVYDESRAILSVYLSRASNFEISTHASFDIATQSWWPFQITDKENRNPVVAARFKPIQTDRETIWLGGASGRISCQPAIGVYEKDGMKVSDASAWAVTVAETDFLSRVMMGPINDDPSQRLLLRDIRVILQENTSTQSSGDQGAGFAAYPTSNQIGDFETALTVPSGQTMYTQFTTDIATLDVFDIEAVQASDVSNESVTVVDYILGTNLLDTGGAANSTYDTVPGSAHVYLDGGGTAASGSSDPHMVGGSSIGPAAVYPRQTDNAIPTYFGPGAWRIVADTSVHPPNWEVGANDARVLFGRDGVSSLPDSMYDDDFKDLADLTNVSYLETSGESSAEPAGPLATFDLRTGRNPALRTRLRSPDFFFQITSSGRAWALEDISVDIAAGGPFRTVETT